MEGLRRHCAVSTFKTLAGPPIRTDRFRQAVIGRAPIWWSGSEFGWEAGCTQIGSHGILEQFHDLR